MVVLKVLTVAIAGLLSFLALRHVMRQMQPVKVRTRTADSRRPQVRRLRQDPRTGIYYPED